MSDTVDLGPRLESLVDDLIKSGRFGTRTEVIQAGLRMIEEQEEALGAMDAALDEGIADARRFVTSAELQGRLASKYSQMPRGLDDT